MMQVSEKKATVLRKKAERPERAAGKGAPKTCLPEASDARAAALAVLASLSKQDWTLDAALESFSGRLALPDREQALFQAIVHGVLRWKGALDPVIAYFSSRPLDRLDPDVLNILRIALFQIRYLDKVPVSAAVNTAVELTRRTGRPQATGFVNALLRAAVSGPSEGSPPEPGVDPVGWLAQSRSFPLWLVSRWVKHMGLEKTTAFCDAQNEIPPITVRVNRLRVSRDRLLEALEAECGKVWSCRYSPDGVSLVNPKTSIPEMASFRQGWFQVQDEAAQLVTLLLDPRPGETVLDACAGLGGKTGHMAQQMQNQGQLLAWDSRADKLARLMSEMRRLGVGLVSAQRKNLEAPGIAGDRERFDRVLVDAPCSGLGVLRRNPDARWSTAEKDLPRHRRKQLRMLDGASQRVKPSGVLVYAVCSTEPEETESVVEAFLKSHPDFSAGTATADLPDPVRALMGKNDYLKTSPLEDQMDGFFAVRLEKRP